ncbi:hypothetical protein B9Z55_028254 [Caenorhabditis nigoni]|uniref:Uncharacterized protein n=1 Tax=Caenorhabditis nigoni TaxID=1611254 RepID=A0A2G5SCW8_9PELO|nr:hypothetical protein B9Z55_028254 [Caenorhabditis nigoni]
MIPITVPQLVTEPSTTPKRKTTKPPTTLPETTTTASIRTTTTPQTTSRTSTTKSPQTTIGTTATPTSTETPSRTTTSLSTTRSTTEYYSPYTPQWRTKHTTQFWDYGSLTSTTPSPISTSITEPETTTTPDLLKFITRTLPEPEAQKRSATRTRPTTTTTVTPTTTTTVKPRTTTSEKPTTTTERTTKETTTATLATVTDQSPWKFHHPHEKIHPWHIPDVGGILHIVSKGVIAIIIALVLTTITGIMLYSCCIPILIKILSRGRVRY